MHKRGWIVGWIVVASAWGACAGAAELSPSGGDWPRFRGDNGSGVSTSTGTPAAFNVKDAAWRIDLPGVGHSSPVVIGKKVFVTCAEPKTAKRFLVCVDLDSGKELWRKEHASHAFRQHTDNSFASASPVADATRVYYTFITPESYKVYCVDHDGKPLWDYDMGRWESQHGCGCSPIVFEDLLIVPNDQDGPTASLVALDAKTGSERWRVERKSGNTSASTPCVFRPKAGGPAQLILTSTASGLTSVDPRTGKTNWAFTDVPPKYRSVGSPLATDEYVVGSWGESPSGPNRLCVVVRPPTAPGGPPDVLFRLAKSSNYAYVPSPVIKGDRMYVWADIGTVNCLKLPGGEPVWQEKVKSQRGRSEFYASPIVAGDKLYNVTKDGVLICVSASDQFKVLGQSDLGDPCFASPAVAGDRLLIRTASKLTLVGGAGAK